MEVMLIYRGLGIGWNRWLVILILRNCCLQLISFLNLSNKEIVIGGDLIFVYASGKQGEVKGALVFLRLLYPLDSLRSLNWLNG